MLPLVRLEKIVELVRSRGNLSIEELCQALGVSSSSIRRDLAKLEACHELRRTHGGAVAVKESIRPPLSFEEKKELNIAAKRRIATKAATLIQAGETVCLDGGTTTQLIAEELTRLLSLTVVTNSLSILYSLCRYPHIKLIAVGGMVKHDIQGIVGNLTADLLEKIHIHKLFLGADGLWPGRGIYTSSEMEAVTKIKMIENSQEVILVADSQKIGQTALVKFSSWENIDLLITDRECQKKYLKEFRNLKLKVLTV
jgi:DeoR/GlpR family transcriptional regulator of sugar metabolism